MEMKEEWLMPGAVVPVDAETTAALVAEIKRLIGVVGGMALGMQPAQEPVAFYVYKPTLPRGHLGNVSDGDLPWVYDQDPSSGYSARMLVYTTPPHRNPLTDEEIEELCWTEMDRRLLSFARAIEAAHGIKE